MRRTKLRLTGLTRPKVVDDRDEQRSTLLRAFKVLAERRAARLDKIKDLSGNCP
jgi:hypothetical protein